MSCTGTRPSPVYSKLVLISVNFGCFLTLFTGTGDSDAERLLSSVRRRFLALLLSSCKIGVPEMLGCLRHFLDRSTEELLLLAALSERTRDSVREGLLVTPSELVDADGER